MQFKSYCAANSGEGFISFFDTLLDEKKRNIYYIKGGPGSGKSTLLKAIAAKANNAELIYCSGDPNSLDGVVLPKENAVIMDATAPHSFEPKYPGVGGNIIDLGEGWSPEKMDRDAIISLCDQKSEVYNTCYTLLRSAKNIQKALTRPIIQNTSLAKINAAVDKILRQNGLWEKKDKVAKVEKRFFSGISPDGKCTYTDTFLTLGKNILILEDRWMIGNLFLKQLDRRLTENGTDHINGYHPLMGKDTLQHIIVPEASLSVVSRDGIFPIDLPEENIIRKITLQSIISKEHLEQNKNKHTFLKRLERELINLAVEKLDEARSIHMKIEAEYAKGTDFDATAPLKEKLMNKLFRKT